MLALGSFSALWVRGALIIFLGPEMPELGVILGISTSALLSCFTPRRDCRAAEESSIAMSYLLDTLEARTVIAYELIHLVSMASTHVHCCCRQQHLVIN